MNLLKKLFGKKVEIKGVCALSFTPEGIALAISENTVTEHPKLIHCEFITTNNKLAVLKQLSERHKLYQYHCHLVLSGDDYRITMIEAPLVTDTEMPDAIRWKISDLIEFSIDDAVLDYYELPNSQRANVEKQLEVISSSKHIIQPLIDLCQNGGLTLNLIDIQETTLRNLATLLPENENGVVLLYLQKSSGRIIIEKQGKIYLSRRLTMGYQGLKLDQFQANGQIIALEQNSLALEIQRSMDYVENHYGLPPIFSIAILPLPEETHQLLQFINNNHGATARIMDLSTIINTELPLDDATQSSCAAVIGATLRNTLA